MSFLEGLDEAVVPPDEVKFRLGQVADDDPLYRAVLKVMLDQARVESESALMPNLSNEARQYNAGRAAAVRDMVTLLEAVRAAGQNLIRSNGQSES